MERNVRSFLKTKEPLDVKNILSEIKYTLERINSKLDTAQENVITLEPQKQKFFNIKLKYFLTIT